MNPVIYWKLTPWKRMNYGECWSLYVNGFEKGRVYRPMEDESVRAAHHGNYKSDFLNMNDAAHWLLNDLKIQYKRRSDH